MLRAVIFDMDGVLVNSEPMHYDAILMLLEELGCSMDYEYYKQFIGTTNTYMWNTMKKDFGISLSIDELNRRVDEKKDFIVERDGFEEIPGVREFVKNLHENGMKLAVASSSRMEDIKKVVEAVGVREYFDQLVTGESVRNPKPAPDIFEKAAKELGVRPDECVVIEDSYNGSRAAHAAAMTCIGFINPDSGDQDLSTASYLVEGFEEIDYRFVKMVYDRAHGEPV